ncbi:MAG: T9SS type A sorting domain-containing protein, partial [Bacteroidales bacterium]|nr:T9SS type A sorting domain-containing protein [Bacteroidales bacterium]
QRTLTYSSNAINGWHVRIDTEGNRYIGGLFVNNDQAWPFVAKFNACGEKVWCKTLTKQAYFHGWVTGMVINKNNEIIVSLNYSTAQLIDRVFLTGFNADGDVLWQNVYASLSNYPLLRGPVIYSMIEHNNEYYLSGYCYWPYPNNPSHVFLRLFFIGIDSRFKEKWILPFAPLDAIHGKAYYTIPVDDTVLMGVGERWLPGVEKVSILMFFDINGQELGYKQILNNAIGPSFDLNIITTAARINDSLFLSPVYLGIYPQTYFGEIVYDIAGNVYNYTMKGHYAGNSKMTKTYDNKYVIGIPVKINSTYSSIYLYKIDHNLQSVPVDTTPRVYDSLCPHPIQSGNIDMSDCMVWVGTEDIPTPDKYYASIKTIPIAVYPNPARDNVTFAFENTEHHKNIALKCYNLLGMQQYEAHIAKGQKESTTNVSHWPAGMYVTVIYSEGRPVGRVKFVVAR